MRHRLSFCANPQPKTFRSPPQPLPHSPSTATFFCNQIPGSPSVVLTMQTPNRCFLPVLLLLLALAPAGFSQDASSGALPPGFQRWELKVDGVAREALVYAPATAKEQPAPVVFVFHGHGGTARNVVRSFAIQRHWPEAISVYMQGLNTPGRLTDPEGKRSGWQARLGDQQDRDLKFFDAVLARLKQDYKVDGEAHLRHRSLERRRLHLPAVGRAGRGFRHRRAQLSGGRRKPAQAQAQTGHAPGRRERSAGQVRVAETDH